MKKLIVFMMMLALCMAMVLPVYAAEQEFVPSITYKDGLDAQKATMNGEGVGNCVVITSIKEAEEKTTDIRQDTRDLLLDIYQKLKDGSMKLPLEGDYVVVELVDINFAHSSCENVAEHNHIQWLQQEGNTITVDLANMAKGLDLVVLVYQDGQWVKVEKVTNNGDGTYTCEFEIFGTVAFCVEADALEEAPATGDNSHVFLWLAVMLAAAACLVVVLMANRRRVAK